MTLSPKIALNDWSLLTKQPIFLMVANLRVWCTLLDYSSDYEEDEDDILDMEPMPEELPTFATHQEQYKKNWKIMANIRKEIIVIRKKMLPISNKFYHHNGLCLLFTCIHSKMLAAQENNVQSMEKEDIHYPTKDEVADDQVYDTFLKLQIPGEPIDLVFDDDEKKDDDDDHHDPKSLGKDDAEPKDSTKPPPSTSPPKDGRDKGKGVAEGSNNHLHHPNSPPKVMEAAMKEKAQFLFCSQSIDWPTQ